MQKHDFEVFKTIYGDSPTMAKWAVENGFHHLLNSGDMQPNVLVEMVRKFQPNVIFIFAGAFYRIIFNLRHQLVCMQ